MADNMTHSMAVRLLNQRTLALLVLASLALLSGLSSIGRMPAIAISDLSKVDSGAVVVVVGVVVDQWSSDAGSSSYVLADLDRQASVKVIHTPNRPSAQTEVHIGDEVRVTGEIDLLGGRPTLWASGDGLTLVRSSREVLSVASLVDSWPLLLGDRFEMRGIVQSVYGSRDMLLRDLDGGASILLRSDEGLSRFADRIVVVDTILLLDSSSMRLVLDVESVSLGP